MPHIVDFNTIEDVKKILVNPKGWISPLYIEYGVGLHYDTTPSYFWRIANTSHTFIIPISRFHFLSAGEYKNHFNEALEGFREDYLAWKKEDFQGADWQQDYKEEYSRYISS